MVNKIKSGDKIAIVSLSSGMLGEKDLRHTLEIGKIRLKQLGFIPVMMNNTLNGIEDLKNNPQKQASDLKQAFQDDSIKAIMCAIGGNTAHFTIPYLLDDPEFIDIIKENQKIFLGFSDTTTHHLMLNKLGLSTFYGQAFITEFGELASEMLPYSQNCFKVFYEKEANFHFASSPIWYEERTKFSAIEVGTDRVSHPETKGIEVLQDNGDFTGKLYGGCLEVIYGGIAGDVNQKEVYDKYQLLKTGKDLTGKVLFIETSENNPKTSGENYRKMIKKLDEHGMFTHISGLIIGKPQNETYYDELKQIIVEEISNKEISILYNLNFGHALPRMILPFDAEIECEVSPFKMKVVSNVFNNSK